MARSITRPRGLPEGTNRTWALAASVGLAVIAAIFAFAALRAAGGGGSGSGTVATTPVVVASQSVNAGDAIPATALRIANVPADSLVRGAYTALDAVPAGAAAAVPIAEGEQILPGKLGFAAGDGRIPVPPDMRAVPIGVTEDKIFGGLLAPGDRVDVVAIITSSGAANAGPSHADTIVLNAEVLAVGEKSLRPTVSTDINGQTIEGNKVTGVTGAKPSDTSTQPDAKNVTLLVTPESAALIALAQENASIWLSLRGPGDNTIRQIAPQILPDR